MSDFWSKALGIPQQAPVAAPAPQQYQQQAAPSTPWWQTSTTPAPAQQQYMPQVQEQPVEPAYAPAKAISALATDKCPSCGSGNYGGGSRMGAAKRCFECGYNDLLGSELIAFGGGSGGGGADGPTISARQVASAHSGAQVPRPDAQGNAQGGTVIRNQAQANAMFGVTAG